MRSIVTYLGRRASAAAVTLLVLTVITFAMVKVIPGDEARVAAGSAASPAQVHATRVRLGLDQPVVTQYVDYLKRLLRGDLGTSITSHTSVSSGLGNALPESLQLVFVAMLLMILIAAPAALISTRRHRTDSVLRVGIVFTAGLPAFWVALVLQYLLATQWHVFPISGEFGAGISFANTTGFSLVDALIAGDVNAFFDGLAHLLLPAVVLALPFTGQLYRTLRTDLMTVMERDFMDVARAKGLSERRLVLRHLVPNAAGSAISVIGATFPMMLGSVVLVESVFGLNGIGSYLTNAVANADQFAVIGAVLATGMLVVASSFLVDLFQFARDPRIRAGAL